MQTEGARELILRSIPNARPEFISEGVPFDYDITELGFALKGTQFSVYDPRFSAYFHNSR